jgi:hypothetical protein
MAREAAFFEERGDVPRKIDLRGGGRRQTIVRGRNDQREAGQQTEQHPHTPS